MSYATIKEVMEYSQQLHHHASNLYLQLRDKTDQARMDMMLKLLASQEETLVETMAKVQASASKKALAEWHQLEPISLQEALGEFTELHDQVSVDELVQVALRIDDYLISIYRNMLSEATNDETRQLFSNLIELENNEKIKTTRAALSMNDW